MLSDYPTWETAEVSERNVELHRRAIEAFNARDTDALIELFDPQIEYHSAMTTPGGADYRGHDGMRRYFDDLEDAWGDEFRVEPEAYFDLGEHTLLLYVALRTWQAERRGCRDGFRPGVQVAGRPHRVPQGLPPERGRAQ
jgi:ketosteroid isomerase-like protein